MAFEMDLDEIDNARAATALVVEHDLRFRFVLGEMLGLAFDLNLTFADDLASARRFCGDQAYDLAIVAGWLPDATGLEVARVLRGAGLPSPILFLVDRPPYLSTASLVELRPAALLSKPIAQCDLTLFVRSLCPALEPPMPNGPLMSVH